MLQQIDLPVVLCRWDPQALTTQKVNELQGKLFACDYVNVL